ncbi:MAG: hypothetical protein H6807_08520 [Planctomycetes bacterium]|nr:hypothetical protein [Planctomycetota bacterium]
MEYFITQRKWWEVGFTEVNGHLRGIAGGAKWANKPKCNLFVAHMIRDAGYGVPMTRATFGWLKHFFGKKDYDRILSAREWYDGKASGYVFVDTPLPGDIVTNGSHMGIWTGESENQYVISASSKDDAENMGVVHNDGGIDPKSMRFLRRVF